MVPDFRRDDVWIPVFTGMTDTDGAFFKKLKRYQRQWRKIYVYGESGRYRFSISLMPSAKYRN